MKEERIVVKSILQSKQFANSFAKSLSGGEVILLNGTLGAGKTTLAQFIFEALGVTDEVNSPTFNIMRSYEGINFSIKHFDMYRIENDDEVYELGFEEFINTGKTDLVFIEWAENVLKFLPESDIINVDIKILGEKSREITVRK